MRAGCQRFQFTEVYSDFLVVNGICDLQKAPTQSFSRPCACKKARVISSEGKIEVVAPKLRTHVGDCSPLRNRKCFHALSCIFHNFANPSFDRMRACRTLRMTSFADTQGFSFPVKIDTNHFRHGDIIRTAAHSHCNIQAAWLPWPAYRCRRRWVYGCRSL